PCTMSILALSPVAPEPPSPMITSMTPVTPTLDPDSSNPPSAVTSLHLGLEKPPPLHTVADWKVVLHLPEIETWLRATSDRVTQLTHSVGQDGDSRHVDAHLVQLKDVCEDISDHVEQIHALLETEFSLKLLSYSVNIIVDIRTVQLLWHQLRVSVLVLKERLLQSLQDSNGNFTRQTDILQAFSEDQHQTRLDALTEVDDCGKLTIRCSQDYFSLDCGITAYELSDYSPGDESEARGAEPDSEDPSQEPDRTRGSNQGPSESAKRPLQGVSHSTGPEEVGRVSGLQFQVELSRSTPSLMDPPDRSKFWLELDSVYPGHVSQSYESLQVGPSVMNGRNLQRNHGSSRQGGGRKSSGPRQTSDAPLPPKEPASQDETCGQMERMQTENHAPSEGDSDSSLPSPMREQYLSSDLEASGEDSDPRPPRGKTGAQVPPKAPADRAHWYGSEEFLALPAQLRKTEMLAMKLESLAHSLPVFPDVEFLPLALSPQLPYRRNLISQFSSASSSDVAPSLDDSIESGPLSDLQSDSEEGQMSANRHLRPTAPPVDRRGGAFVQQLDGFISWLQEALDSTENWTPPRQELDSLRVYLDTHLSFKLNVDSHGALKESIMEEGRALLPVITSHRSGLKDILHMVSSQWDQLQRQIRRQHSWMLRALRCIQTRLLYTGHQSHQPLTQAVLEQMAVKLSSLQYPSPAKRIELQREFTSVISSLFSLQEFEAEYQELWDWLMDMDTMVTDSHQLMMSEEQRHHLFKLTMMESRKTSLLGRAESLKRSATELPADFHRKIHNLTRSQQSRKAGAAADDPRSALSPLTNSLLEQLEARIKELKVWLRDTELLIFNSCLRRHRDASEQLHSFKSLCSEVRARRRGVSSVLKLCQKLLQQSKVEAEQHWEALQLLSINLERRWEAIVMQALQWQNRLKRELGEQQVPGNFLEPGLVDLHQMSPDDSWEWDETDMTITEPEPQEPDLTHNLPTKPNVPSDNIQSDGNGLDGDPASQCPKMASRMRTGSTSEVQPGANNIYQVYSLHSVEFYRQPPFSNTSSSCHEPGKRKQHLLLKSSSKDSSFSSLESLPDLLGGLSDSRGGNRDGEGGRGSGQSASSRRSESESGIVSDTGDMETTTISPEAQGEEEGKDDRNLILHKVRCNQRRTKTEENRKEKVWKRDESTRGREEEKRRRHKKGGGETVEILINGRGILTPANSDFDMGGLGTDMAKVKGDHFAGLVTPPALSHIALSPVVSRSSSLESILDLGVELFPSKDPLHRSASLESCLQKKNENVQGEPSSGELSRRTLDLLKRLENIQTPLAAKMTRSVSDMTLRSSSPQRSRLPPSPSLGGDQLSGVSSSSRKGPPSLINESSATASLTELSSPEDSSLGSEDFAVLRNQHHLLPDPTMAANANSSSHRKRCHVNGRAGADKGDAASLSLLVNVSCTSACTDEDEDDSDLLSSSTLTLTEEELGDDEDEDAEEMEGSYILGLEYMKRELQSWIRSPRASSLSSKTEADLLDELQCGTNLSTAFTSSSKSNDQHSFVHRTAETFMETNMNSGNNQTQSAHKERDEEEENRRNATRSYISQFVDDVENGNVDQSCLKGKDEDDELLREESSVFTKKGEQLRESYVFAKTGESVQDVSDLISKMESKELSSSASCELLPFLTKRASSLVGQLRGELPCHSSCHPSPPSLSPVGCRSHDALQNSRPATGGRKAITIQEKFKFSSLVMEETKREVRNKQSSLLPKKRHSSHSSCCSHLPSPSALHPPSVEEGRKENVHDFVMEIIDMTSLALKSKESPPEDLNQNCGSILDLGPASPAQIRDKVLEHSHRPLHLRKGDFYSYLSLSSHDSDCGEVSQCSEDKSSTPLPYSIPACVSPTQGLPERLADTKTLQSNMGAVMTKISVCSSATNPSKEPAATATRINPKINCWPMREADREAGSRRGKQEEKGRRGWSGSQQEAAPEMQVSAAGVILRITQVLSAQLQVLVPPPSGPVAPERC
uniref:Uncharacterized protein n=1 Tax=Mola mola TaxID=94237 RepID=A0A3Q3WXX9_MOLML